MVLIVLEGIDGCGKETQIKLLRERLPDAVLFKYPTTNYALLNDYLEKKVEIDQKALFLLFLSDIANEQKKVRATLDAGKTVILDRYVFSTIAYELNSFLYPQAKKIVEGVGFIRPDVSILLDITPDVSQERKRKQKQLDRYEENREYLAKVRESFIRLYEEHFLSERWVRLDASKSVEELNRELLRELKVSA